MTQAATTQNDKIIAEYAGFLASDIINEGGPRPRPTRNFCSRSFYYWFLRLFTGWLAWLRFAVRIFRVVAEMHIKTLLPSVFLENCDGHTLLFCNVV